VSLGDSLLLPPARGTRNSVRPLLHPCEPSRRHDRMPQAWSPPSNHFMWQPHLRQALWMSQEADDHRVPPCSRWPPRVQDLLRLRHATQWERGALQDLGICVFRLRRWDSRPL